MRNIEIFENFMNLGYSKSNRLNRLRDSVISELIILRSTFTGDTIYYLQTGCSLFIPGDWMELFKSLYVHSGDQILYKKEPRDSDYYDNIIYLNIKLINILTGSKIDGNKFLDTLGDVSNLGTEKFRKMLKNKYDLYIEPFEYRSIEKTLEI
jgi:hypothetical protein